MNEKKAAEGPIIVHAIQISCFSVGFVFSSFLTQIFLLVSRYSLRFAQELILSPCQIEGERKKELKKSNHEEDENRKKHNFTRRTHCRKAMEHNTHIKFNAKD